MVTGKRKDKEKPEMEVSQLEVNFTRLLARCEGLAAEKRFTDWRMESYLKSLEEWLTQLSNLPCNMPDAPLKVARPPPELIASYKKKIEFLKNLTATEKLTKAGAKALTSSQLLGVGQMGPTQATTADKSVGKTSELQLAAKGRLNTNLRDELFGDKKVEDEIGPAQSKETKKETKSGMTSEDFDQVVQHHKQTQERIAEEMLSMARSLKESTSAAGKVVREDTRRIQASSRLADSNLEKLETQSKRLEAHVKKCCDWGLWIALLAVCVTFIMMIGFMKLFKKRTF